jgi:hypothetical protein
MTECIQREYGYTTPAVQALECRPDALAQGGPNQRKVRCHAGTLPSPGSRPAHSRVIEGAFRRGLYIHAHRA